MESEITMAMLSGPTPIPRIDYDLYLAWPQGLMALCLWREARGATRQAKVAIAYVIVNRAEDAKNRWPKSLMGVITQNAQFTSIAPPIHASPAEIRNATTWPKDNDPDWAECCEVAQTFRDESDPSNGANMYYSDPIEQKPAWADETQLTARIGTIHFYKI